MVTLVTVIVMPRGVMKVQVFGCSLTGHSVVPGELLGGQVAAGGGGGGAGPGSVLLLGKCELGADGGGDLRVVGGDGLRNVRGRGLEAILVSDPVNPVQIVVGTDVLVGAAHDYNLRLANLPHSALGLLLNFVLSLEVVVELWVGAGTV